MVIIVRGSLKATQAFTNMPEEVTVLHPDRGERVTAEVQEREAQRIGFDMSAIARATGAVRKDGVQGPAVTPQPPR
jgi:hypothetical protein